MGENKSREEMLLDMIHLAVEINGTECRKAILCDKPTVFVRYSGHVAELEISIFLHGWEDYKDADFRYVLYFDNLFSRKEYDQAYAALETLRDMGKDEK